MDVFSVQIFLWMYLTTTRNEGHIYKPEMTIDVSKLLNSPSTQGTVIFKDSYITGLNTLKVPYIPDINATANTDVEGDNFDICVTLPMDELTITTKYVLDIALWGRIPIYGDGNLTISLSNVVMDLCTFASNSEAYVDNMNLHMSYRHGPSSITGLNRHPDVDRMGSQLLEIGNLLFAMWNRYEPEKASCFLSPIMQYLMNYSLEYENINPITFNTTCLQDSTLGNLWRNSKGLYQEIHYILRSNSDSTFAKQNQDSNEDTNYFQDLFSLLENIS